MNMTVVKLYSGFVLCGFIHHVYAVVVVDSPGADKSVHSSLSNCTAIVNVQSQSLDGNDFILPMSKRRNCSDVEVTVERIPDAELHWKNQVIIACMVTVAVEILIVALMVMCWRQIRWTLLKLTCPSWCCRGRRLAAQQQRNAAVDNTEVESDSNNVGNLDTNASVQLYVPVDQDSIDSIGDGMWHNAGQSSHSVDGPSYIQLRHLPQSSRDHSWQAFTNSSDDSDSDEPSSNFGRVSIPVISTASANSIEASENFLMFTGADPCLCLERVELEPVSAQGINVGETKQLSDSDLQGSGLVYPSCSAALEVNVVPRNVDKVCSDYA